LGCEIEWNYARERAAARNRGRRGRRVTVEEEYDPHAATELGYLIARRMGLAS
jgi:hypothetical protein